MNEYMKIAIDQANKGTTNKEGGPFGAVIIDSNGNIISYGNNTVLKDHDPTAHAEVNAIRMASKIKNSPDLSDCTLYTTCEPCPMCLSAIIWARIKKVYYGCTKDEATNIGFSDAIIYDYLENKNHDLVNLKQIDHDECIQLFDNYKGDLY